MVFVFRNVHGSLMLINHFLVIINDFLVFINHFLVFVNVISFSLYKWPWLKQRFL